MDVTQHQNTTKEIEFFDTLAAANLGDYDVFMPATNDLIIQAFVDTTKISAGSSVLDLGCGSACFARLLQRAGYKVTGIDLSFGMLLGGRRRDVSMDLAAGNAERLPFRPGSFDAVLLSGLLHHLADPGYCADEVFRILKSGESFLAFDPNRANPFFFLYRTKTSPFYSSVGVSGNEQPIVAQNVAKIFAARRFIVKVDYLKNVEYRTGSSRVIRVIRPFFNIIERFVFGLTILRTLRAFVLISGKKVTMTDNGGHGDLLLANLFSSHQTIA